MAGAGPASVTWGESICTWPSMPKVVGRRCAAMRRTRSGPGMWSQRPRSSPGPGRLAGEIRDALRVAETDPAALLLPENEKLAIAILSADGTDLDAVAAVADDLRRDVVGDEVTYVVNRNINFTNICYTGCRFCAFAQRRSDADAYSLSIDEVVTRAQEAWDLGATEVCLQGGIDPQIPASHYLDLVRAITAALPELHIHAFSPMEVATGAAHARTSIPEFLAALQEAGLGSLPGTAAEILDDDVRWVLTKGKLPTATWIEVVESAHQLGLPTSSTMMFGHVDRPDHWLTHLRVLAAVQDNAADARTRRLHRVRAAALRAPVSTPLPGWDRTRGADRGGDQGSACGGPAAAARAHRPHPGLVGQARRVRRADHARFRSRRPRRDPHGGDHQSDGRERPRIGHSGVRAGRVGCRRRADRRGSGPRPTVGSRQERSERSTRTGGVLPAPSPAR